MTRKPPRATIDFETRSVVSLKKYGTWRYSLHPKTSVMCLVFRLPHWKSGRTAVWHPAYPNLGIMKPVYDPTELQELFDWIESGGIIEAHNAWFERCIWQHIMVPRYQFPKIPPHAWRCSAAQAAACALPRGLDDALAAAGLAMRKDGVGYKVMKKMNKPRKPRKLEREKWMEKHGPDVPHKTVYFEDRHLLDQLIEYCRQDVLAEEALSYVLPDLSPDETELYLLDQRINERGFQLDLEAVEVALRLLAMEATRLNARLAEITQGAVTKASQREKIKAWLSLEGVDVPDTTAETLDGILAEATYLTPDARQVIEIMRALGRSSTAKYQAMKWHAAVQDGKVRGGLLFHGASTGRWSGSGVQPHNFPKGTLKVKMDELWAVLKTEEIEDIIAFAKSIMVALSHGLRGAIIASEGHELFVADFAAIEARVLLWVAEDESALDIFRRGEDIYCDMASSIYKIKVTKEEHPDKRQMGKQAILGLGYQMGAPKFKATCEKYGIEISEDLAYQVVDAYRKKYWRVKALWQEQEEAAIRAVKSGVPVDAGYVQWIPTKKFLFCELPSGRRLAYPDPKVSMESTSWGTQKETLSFMGVDSYTRQWRRQKTYGGMIVENIVQAIARDLLAEAMVRCEQSGRYLPILSVHDEIIAEAPVGVGTVDEFNGFMQAVPDWAKGCPVEAEAWKGQRYHK